MQPKNWFLFSIFILLPIGVLFAIKQGVPQAANADSPHPAIDTHCPTPTATATLLPPPTSPPLAMAQVTTTPTPVFSSPCSYLPIIQYQSGLSVCPTATPETSPTTPPYPTPVPLKAAEAILDRPCVTATPRVAPTSPPYPTPIPLRVIEAMTNQP